MIRSQIPRFRLPEEVIDEETGYVLKLGVEFRGGTRIDSMKALLAERWDAVFVGSGAPRGRDLSIPGRQEAAANIHIGIDWLSSVSFGHVTQDRQAGDRARRRQHRHGLLPQLQAPRRQRRQGDRALAVRGDEGLALGEGRRHPRRHSDPRLPGAQGLPAHQRQAHRHELRQGARGARRERPAPARLHRRARAGVRVRRRAGRGRPGERLPLDRARPRPRLRRMGHAGARSGDAAVQPAARLLRRRRRARAEEHHLGRRAGPRRGDLDRQVPATARTSPCAPPPA